MDMDYGLEIELGYTCVLYIRRCFATEIKTGRRKEKTRNLRSAYRENVDLRICLGFFSKRKMKQKIILN
jgi:hypothetical protein